MKHSILLLSLLSLMALTSCNKNDEGVNIFTIDQDKELGMQVKQEIASDPAQYPILNRTTYSAAYAYLDQMKTTILNSGSVT
ncbi:MAG: hypothetical protein IT257_11780, partial [Chitinophagaceae bacterium]|nr:hypothetical protein [Chitinophagaceae bacterium]